MEANIRVYRFNTPGFIPGVPGDWPAGSQITVDEDTKIVLDWGPKPVEQSQDIPPALEPVQQAG